MRPTLLQDLPNTALAAIVIASAIGLIEVADLRRIYRIQRWEFWLSMACFAGVAVFGAIPGIVLAIVIAVIEFLWDGWRPHSAVLGRVDHVKGYHDITRYPNARLIPGLVLFRWDAPLFFANAEFFHDRVLDAVASSPTPVRWLVVAAEPVTSIDVTAADAVSELDDALHAAGIEMLFAEMKDPVKDKLKRFGLFTHFGEQSFLCHHRGSCQRLPRRPSGRFGGTHVPRVNGIVRRRMPSRNADYGRCHPCGRERADPGYLYLVTVPNNDSRKVPSACFSGSVSLRGRSSGSRNGFSFPPRS